MQVGTFRAHLDAVQRSTAHRSTGTDLEPNTHAGADRHVCQGRDLTLPLPMQWGPAGRKRQGCLPVAASLRVVQAACSTSMLTGE